jgi:hypothetical protein
MNNTTELCDDNILNNFDNNFTILPDDLKRKIYDDYFKEELIAEKLCNDVLIELNTKNSYCLCKVDLEPLIKKVLENKIAIKNLCEISDVFKDLYTKIIINKSKNFINLYNDSDINKATYGASDLALSWLYMLYH